MKRNYPYRTFIRFLWLVLTLPFRTLARAWLEAQDMVLSETEEEKEWRQW